MGLMKKKGKVGEVKKFITRAKALKKLQISLKDFRRLCIWKGIYPRVPKNKKKLTKGSSKLTTWYYRRDIQYLLHEPLLEKLREWKTYAKKISKLKAKSEWTLIEKLSRNEPQFKLDHIIKERYPTFQDALKDLDDSLSIICLFASLPQLGRHLTSEFLAQCQQKRNDFFKFVAQTHALKKAFVSIKGIYLQVEIEHQLITWVVPHPFSVDVPKDVDFKIMVSFAQFYETLLGFVLFKLYKDQQWSYPSTTSSTSNSSSSSSWPCTLDTWCSSSTLTPSSTETISQSTSSTPSTTTTTTLDTFVPLNGNSSETTPSLSSSTNLIFKGLIFYLSRETNASILALIIYSLGGEVGWSNETIESPSPYKELDPRITHQVMDRPSLPFSSSSSSSSIHSTLSSRIYVQPQYIFDCLNSQQRLLVSQKNGFGYAPGERLPPHLSPFTTSTPYDYQPEDPEVSIEKVPSKPLAHIMMSKKHQKLYDRIQRTRAQKVAKIKKLKQKRALIEKLKHQSNGSLKA